MPHLSPIYLSNKDNLVLVFKSKLLTVRTYKCDLTSKISFDLVKYIIEKKSFGATFNFRSGMSLAKINSAITNLTANICDRFLPNTPFQSESDFDAFHKTIGDKFIADCAACSQQVSFGHAQKIINITLKHLFCYDIDPTLFKYCHIALDSITCVGNSHNSLNGGFYHNEVNRTATRVRAFSHLKYQQYVNIQNEMREYLGSPASPYKDCLTGLNLTPFEAEFYIWPLYAK